MTDRDWGVGPFKAAREGQVVEIGPAVPVFDKTGRAMCWVALANCQGGLDAGKARATRIAEALNRGEGHAAPAPYIDDHGNLRAPEGYGFVANGEKCEMVPLISIKLSPAP